MSDYLEDHLGRLMALTHECRDNMHEPDEQGVDVVKWRGRKLDNAFNPETEEIAAGFPNRERCFLLRNEDTGEEGWFNLAAVIALARKAIL